MCCVCLQRICKERVLEIEEEERDREVGTLYLMTHKYLYCYKQHQPI